MNSASCVKGQINSFGFSGFAQFQECRIQIQLKISRLLRDKHENFAIPLTFGKAFTAPDTLIVWYMLILLKPAPKKDEETLKSVSQSYENRLTNHLELGKLFKPLSVDKTVSVNANARQMLAFS